MQHRTRIAKARGVALLAALGVVACSRAPEVPPQPVHSMVFLSDPLLIDGIYRSMTGPQKDAIVQIGNGSRSDLLWIVGYETEIIDPTTGDRISDEFMCHNNLNAAAPASASPQLARAPMRRLFTLSQGAMKVELPPGFGIPILSSEQFRLTTQVLNLNPIQEDRRVRYRTTVKYVRDDERTADLKPLYQVGVQGLKLLEGEDGYYGVDPGADEEQHGESCSIGQLAGKRVVEDGYGRSFAAHWVVPPGHEENHTLVTEFLDLPQDTTIHYIAVHLHPFATSLALRDLTTGETVFESHAANRRDRIGLSSVESFSSVEGIRVFADHEYALVSVYDNDSGEPQDAMAVMYLYLLDKQFQLRSVRAGRI